MSRLGHPVTPYIKRFFQRSPSAVGNIRHFGSSRTSGSFRSVVIVGKVNPNLFGLHKSCLSCGVGNGYRNINVIRTISSSLKFLKDVEESGQVPSSVKDTDTDNRTGVPRGKLIKPSLRQKRILVWAKKYPSVAKVPEYVPESRMINAADIVRIKVNLLTMLVFLIASYITIKIGQRQRAKFILQRQQQSDEFNDLLDLYDAELEKENETRQQTEKK